MLCLGLCGCATAGRINRVSLGMSKEEVIKVMGRPVSTSAEKGTEYLNYKLAETSTDDAYGISTPYAVCLRGGKVVSYGRHGDFGTTEQPAQVIKVIGDLKSDEKINVQTENNGELEKKLKTLNKLLTDGFITKNEFDSRRKNFLMTIQVSKIGLPTIKRTPNSLIATRK